MLHLGVADSLLENDRSRLEKVFATDEATGRLKAAWEVKDQVSVLLFRTSFLEDTELAKERLEELVQAWISTGNNQAFADHQERIWQWR